MRFWGVEERFEVLLENFILRGKILRLERMDLKSSQFSLVVYHFKS